MPVPHNAPSVSRLKRAPLTSEPPAVGAPIKRKRRTQAERKEEAEQRLLHAALMIVSERGSARLTLADVGEAAGYSRGLPLHYFGSKEGLLRALAVYIRDQFTRYETALVKCKPGLDTILAFIDEYFSLRETRSASTRALLIMLTESFFENSVLAESMKEYNRTALAFMESHIRKGIEQKEIHPDAETRASAVIILGAIRGIMLQKLNDPEIDFAAVRKQMLVSVRRILKAPGNDTTVRKALR